jgi:hypothetical protein
VHSRLLNEASSKVVVELHQDTSGGIMIIVIAWILDFLKRHRSASPDAALRLDVVLRVLVVARIRAVIDLFVCCSCGLIDIGRRGCCEVRCMRCPYDVVVA